MRIGIDIRNLDTTERTGVGHFTFSLLDELFRHNTEHDYFLFHNAQHASTGLDDLKKMWSSSRVQFVTFSWPNKVLNGLIWLIGQPKIDQLITKKIGDVVDYFFSPNLNFTTLGNTKHILTIHDLTFWLFPHLYTPKQQLWHAMVRPRKQAALAHKIVVPSENTKRDILTYWPEITAEKITVIYPGLTVPLTTETNVTFPKNYFLCLGTREPRKNYLSVIRAFESIAGKLPRPYTLILAGAQGWKNKDISSAIVASPFRSQIKDLGFVSETEKNVLLRNASVFLYPSLYEGFGFPVLEAMQQGVPVITSNRSSLPEITGSAAYLVNPNHPEEIATGLQQLVGNEKIRQEKITVGLAQAQKFTWTKTAQTFLQSIK